MARGLSPAVSTTATIHLLARPRPPPGRLCAFLVVFMQCGFALLEGESVWLGGLAL